MSNRHEELNESAIVLSQLQCEVPYTERCQLEKHTLGEETCSAGLKEQPWGYNGEKYIHFYRYHIRAKHIPGFCVNPEKMEFENWTGMYTLY